MIKTRFDGQYSEQALISGEQFGMGGISGGVRGFNERELIGDRGIRGSMEIWSPRFWQKQLRVLSYVDAGYLSRLEVLPGELNSESISSAGIGLLWQYKKKLSLSLYLSQALNGNDSPTAEDPTLQGDNKIQFNLFINY